ncbi:MAG: TerB family tellurite resistance protein [Bacteroidales bacterium]|nr:TerB family tellurite resistance protein [Bacteroidales bacterium]
MKTDKKNIAAFVAAAIWADGQFDEAEKVTVDEIADALEIEDFSAVVEAEVENIKQLEGEAVAEYLEKAAEGVDDEDVATVFEVALQIVLCDGVLAHDEISNLLLMADALGVEHEDAVLLLADMLVNEEDITVEL